MFSHIMVGANDIEESKKFYDATLGVLGYKPGVIDPKGRVFYVEDTGIFSITKPLNGAPACGANGGTIGFTVESADQGDAWHAAGLAAGGTACEDPPGVRNAGTPNAMYLAYLLDPARNKICALKHL
jgi:catechol 2,3-dioxygenase-like lactoylglutathione lyase family enzyme